LNIKVSDLIIETSRIEYAHIQLREMHFLDDTA